MLIIFLSLSLVFAGEKYSADLYDLDGKTKLFTYEAERAESGQTMTYTAVYKDLSGQVVAQEKGEAVQGVFTKYEASRPPLEESGSVEVKDGKIHFNYTEKTKTSSSKDNFKNNTLFSGTLVPFLQANMDKVVGGQELSFPYVVWYRKETVGFKFVFDKEESGKLVFKMVPTNMLYRSLVNPLFFTLDKTTKKLISVKGRTMPKIKDGSRWKDVDSFVQYK